MLQFLTGLLFGIGWGLAGLCPGPGLTALGCGTVRAVVFTLAMLAALTRVFAGIVGAYVVRAGSQA